MNSHPGQADFQSGPYARVFFILGHMIDGTCNTIYVLGILNGYNHQYHQILLVIFSETMVAHDFAGDLLPSLRANLCYQESTTANDGHQAMNDGRKNEG